MKQRLGIAASFLGNPNILVLDEPINGLDPEGIREIRQTLLRHYQKWEHGKGDFRRRFITGMQGLYAY